MTLKAGVSNLDNNQGSDYDALQLGANYAFSKRTSAYLLFERTTPCPQAERGLQVVTTVAATPNPSFRRVDVHVAEGATPLLRVSGLIGRY